MTNDKNILIRNVYYMLAYAFQQLRQNNYENIAVEEFENVFDLFAEIILRGVSSVLKQGLHRDYISQHDDLTALRGKLDINGTIHNKMQHQQRVACKYDEFAEDNLFNQILKGTMTILLQHADVKPKRKNVLHNVLMFFTNVSSIQMETVRWSMLRFDHNTQIYQMLLYLCYFIQQEYLLTTDSGEYRMHSFSDNNMCRLFEKFILEYYRKHHPELHAEAGRIEWNINKELSDTSILPIMQTDVMLHFPDRTLIIDAKYYGQTLQEHFGKHTLHSANFYQIQAYVNNLDRQHKGNVDGMLVYALTQEDFTPDSHVVFKDGNVFYFKTLNLNQKFSEIKKQLDLLLKSNKDEGRN